MMTHEIQDSAVRLALASAKATAELLQEQRRTVGGPQEEKRVDVRQIDPFVEKVHGKEDVDPTGSQIAERLLALVGRRVRPYCCGLNAVLSEYASHETRMLNADAESKSTHPAHRIDVPRHRLKNQPGP
jgi:hypothetical protein